MTDIEELLQGLDDSEEAAEDRTIYARETPEGRKIDFEIIETTSFAKAYPETVREYRSQLPIDCGHPVDKNHPFGGYCQCTLGRFKKRTCGRAYCAECAYQCPKCGAFVSTNCCVSPLDEVLVCKACSRSAGMKKLVSFMVRLVLDPFISEGTHDG